MFLPCLDAPISAHKTMQMRYDETDETCLISSYCVSAMCLTKVNTHIMKCKRQNVLCKSIL